MWAHRIVLPVVVFCMLSAFLSAQSREVPLIPTDTSIHSFKDYLNSSTISGQLRDYFMSTVNEGALTDYYSNAIGAALKYETPVWHGLQGAIRGRFAHRTFLDNANTADPLVNRPANWERELYDVDNPEANTVYQIEELYLRFHFSRSRITMGKMDLNRSPLLLKRGGRMNGFAYRGLWLDINELEQQKIQLGWINGVVIRGRTTWRSIDNALGRNSNGLAPNGERSNYAGTTNTKGIGVFSYENTIYPGVKIQVWNYFFHRLSNISWFQVDYKSNRFLLGGQLAYQVPMGFQEQLNYVNRYMQPDEKGIVLNVQLGIYNKIQGWELSANYLQAFDSGRFLFPRELGRENFYASQPRTWLDGQGDTDIFMLRFKFKPPAKNWQFDLRLSKMITPGLDQLTFNKYNIATLNQATLDVKYKMDGVLPGLKTLFRYATRLRSNTDNFDPRDKFYRINYQHFNLITTLDF